MNRKKPTISAKARKEAITKANGGSLPSAQPGLILAMRKADGKAAIDGIKLKVKGSRKFFTMTQREQAEAAGYVRKTGNGYELTTSGNDYAEQLLKTRREDRPKEKIKPARKKKT